MNKGFWTLGTLAPLAVTVGLVVGPLQQVNCCGDADEAAEREMVVVLAEDGDEAATSGLCGATVTATRGEEVVELTEVPSDDGCLYRADLDPEGGYDIVIDHPEHGQATRENTGPTQGCAATVESEPVDWVADFSPPLQDGDAGLADGGDGDGGDGDGGDGDGGDA